MRSRFEDGGRDSPDAQARAALAQAKLPPGVRVVSYVIDEVVGDGGDAGGFIQKRVSAEGSACGLS